MFAALALYVGSGFYILSPDESGVIERFGRKLLPYREPGLHYKLPWPVDALTRIKARRVRVVEIGFRTVASTPENEPASYEWNAQHSTGRFQKVPEESAMLTGDQNMIELYATVHYVPAHPDDFLFRQLDGDGTVRAAAESVMQSVVTSSSLDDVLTEGRRQLEQRARDELQRRLDQYGAGVQVLEVKLEDVHPALEVVDAFREVSDAFEEKNRLINEAEGYRNEQLALAQGNAKAALENARAYSLGRKTRAEGDASRFLSAEAAFRDGAGGHTVAPVFGNDGRSIARKEEIDYRHQGRPAAVDAVARRNRLAQRAASFAGVGNTMTQQKENPRSRPLPVGCSWFT